MSKNRQSMVLSNWFTIDRILFGKQSPKDVLGEQDFSGYITAKGAFLETVHTIYKKVGFDSKKSFKNLSEMAVYANEVSEQAKKRARKIVQTEAVAVAIRSEISSAKLTEGLTMEQSANFVVNRKLKAIALDVAILESAIKQTGKKSLRDFSGKVALDAYRTLRDSLVKYAG